MHFSSDLGRVPSPLPVGDTRKKMTGPDKSVLEEDVELVTSEDLGASGGEATGGILQLDASLKKLKWTMHYIQTSNGLPMTAKHLLRTLVVEMVVQETILLLDVASDVSLMGDVWVTDFTAKELPNSHTYNSLEREDSYIVHQELYYRKTKPPRLGGGTMDTRRASRDDGVLKVSFSYSKDDLKGS